ncbi:ABC transporter substrate binding protein [Colwellia sp. 1_MG-2023]|uniref:ABC transporter substrate binding protein n=1 Tax=Colwellia sp. 1_MG-2023 TaxID=3062649 RepID=UPI0026E38A15|nr:ABC transporter substrate binding protein [Colwellia sp. 1_MG-2023]MDO6446517.1 ABC transporter substrate binding protein [Colwellia sp. 1_MG-2023]
MKVAAEELTVVYPEVNAPYDQIFQQITRGIQSEFKGKVHHLKLPRTFDAEKQANMITTHKVIALGKRGMRIAKQLYNDKPVVVGALPIKPNGISGVSLMADPNVLFDSLHELAPEITAITVLYSPASEWIISDAQTKALAKGLKLHPIAVDDIKAAVIAYNKIFEGSNLEKMAIWLPLDPVTANEKIIVPTILEKAWENKMVVFSSKPTHAKRGALFSALPDNELLGQQLSRLINSVNYKSRPSTVKTLEKIKLAVNLRTAAHLGFDYNSNERSGFALTFPN